MKEISVFFIVLCTIIVGCCALTPKSNKYCDGQCCKNGSGCCCCKDVCCCNEGKCIIKEKDEDK